MTDRELLELAAKAAGLCVVDRSHPFTLYVQSDGCCGGMRWNPLTDDGAALWLAVKLRLHVLTPVVDGDCAIAHTTGRPGDTGYVYVYSEDGIADPTAATRRAIVLAAAEIGITMTRSDT